MAALQPVRGTRDLLPADMRRHRWIEETAYRLAERYGYGEISTPVFEFTEVFDRSLGDTSDIVSKEMYTFEDRGGARITLRPENTAGVVRAFLCAGLTHQVPARFFYRGPMFRYERPQKGRLRQFHQVGVELLGAGEPLADVEVIALGADLLAALGLADRVTLAINSLGDSESRAAYRAVLVAYLEGHRTRLSAESRARMDRNPLRILDSKEAEDQEIIAQAPSMADSLTPAARAFYQAVLSGLDALAIPYRQETRLVRGLDYYCHTAFEFTTDALGAQNAVLAGGRYDGLAEQLGGSAVPGIGWAAGVERLALLAAGEPDGARPIAVIPVAADQDGMALAFARDLRRAGYTVEFQYGGSMQKRLKRANRAGARAAVILGESERARGVATVRDMDSGEQSEVPLTELTGYLARFR